jgi:hypothetical protein
VRFGTARGHRGLGLRVVHLVHLVHGCTGDDG